MDNFSLTNLIYFIILIIIVSWGGIYYAIKKKKAKRLLCDGQISSVSLVYRQLLKMQNGISDTLTESQIVERGSSSIS